MVLLPGYTTTAVLQEGKKAVLYQAIRVVDGCPVIIKGLHSEQCTPRNIEQLQHEFAIAQCLDSSAIVNAYALEPHQGIPYLILEDFGGQSLDQLVDRFQAPLAFLKLAIQVTTALTHIHRSHVVHKDIKPANIIVNPDTQQVKIGDFGLAAFIPHGQQMVSSDRRIEGSLAYLSPEQTGRMNREIDCRSDLYSLGITFYELLTGQLPFQGNDPLEWVHCHIARSPVPPIEVLPTLPQSLSDIVLKLLAKVPEARYQSAAGLQADLERCLESLAASGNILPFPLGEQDISERLQIPQKLYGRDREVAQLLDAFECMIAQGKPELMLVGGYAGIGKSALVNELHKPIVRERGIFISGKFDQYKRDIPYATLVQAFQTLTRQILTEPEAKLARWKQRLQTALGNNGKLITAVIPEVEWLIGEQPPLPELGPAEAQNRFNLVFQSFINAFAQKESPLVIFLDDMQWADNATLNFIQTLLTGSLVHYLYFILAYRDNEVDLSHPFQLTIDKLRQSSIRLSEIVLTPLQLTHVSQLISETLHCPPQQSAPLARLVWQKTDGNPFFVTEFLKTLYQENLLTFNPPIAPPPHRPTAFWHWDIAQIEAQGLTDNIVTLMLGRMQKLPSATQQVLKLASCFGNQFGLSILSTMNEKAPEETVQALQAAIFSGLIVSIDQTEALEKTYRFRHDRIQQAAYSLIPEAQKQAVHLKIGRLILQNTSPEHREETLFDIVNQLNIGIVLITDRTEQEELLKLNLTAAQKAKASIAYTPALKYLNAATQLLSADAWETAYTQTYTLFREWAECEYLTGNLEQADVLFQVLLTNAQSKLDQANIYRLQLRLYQIAGKYDEALALGLNALKLFDVTFPETEAEAQHAAAVIKAQIANHLGDRQISDLLNAPILQDPTLRTVINLLTTASPPAYLSQPSLFLLLVLTAVSYSLKYGNTEDSCFAYSMYAMLLVSVLRDIPAGVAFSEMTIQLNQKLNDPTLKGTVVHIHGSHINVWRNHMATDLPFLEQGFLGCVEVGDVTMANYNGYQGSWQIIETVFPLPEAYQAIQKYASFAQQSRHEATYQTIRLQQQFVMNWRGLTHHHLTLSDDEFDEVQSLSILIKAGFSSGIAFYHILKLIIGFTYEQYEAAQKAAVQASEHLGTILSLPIEANYVLYQALTLAALYPTASEAEQAQLLTTLNQRQQQLQYWADHCAANFLHKALLVRAEIARLEGQDMVAMRLYEESIRSAREHGFVQYEALANELAAKFYLARDFETIAKTYLQEAKNAYQRWGAISKVNHLEECYPTLLPQPEIATNPTFLGTSEQLDLLSVVKASQTISSEIVRPQLLQTLMQIVLEQAGADTSYLLLCHEHDLVIEAEAKVNQEQLEVSPVSASTKIADIAPQSMLNYVQRTQEAIILDPSTKQSLFFEDEYLLNKQPKSALCLPIVRQATLIGLLYLENNFLSGAFTYEKLAILDVLTTQIAISLENARLYQTLEDSQERLNLALQSGKIGTWTWDIINDKIDWDQQVYRLLGVTPETFDGSLEAVLARLHPDDVAPHNQSVKQAIAEGVEHNSEFRVRWEDGSLHHIAARGRAIFNEAGVAVRMSGTVYDLSDRKQAEAQRLQLAQAQAARTEAEKANRIKDEFLAVLSHELRSPLNPILGWAKLLQTREFDEPTRKRALETIERNAKLQAQLIEDLLDVSRILRGKLLLNTASINLVTIIQAAIETVRLAAEAKEITIHTVFASAVGQVMGDAARLQQILWNLLTNAVKFTPNGGQVVVRLEQVDTVVQIQVSDTGKGITPEFLPYVFEYFRQEDSKTTRKFGGLGLGLAIVRYLTELHGGTVAVESAGEGQGVTFTVKLPLMKAEARKTWAEPTLALPPSLTPLLNVQVLVVDDKADTRELTAFILEQAGAIVTVVPSALAALDVLTQFQPDVLVSDIGMPGMDGYALIRQIRQLPEPVKLIPAVALTAYAGEVDQQQAIDAGFQIHLSKPVEPEAITAVIARLSKR